MSFLPEQALTRCWWTEFGVKREQRRSLFKWTLRRCGVVQYTDEVKEGPQSERAGARGIQYALCWEREAAPRGRGKPQKALEQGMTRSKRCLGNPSGDVREDETGRESWERQRQPGRPPRGSRQTGG